MKQNRNRKEPSLPMDNSQSGEAYKGKEKYRECQGWTSSCRSYGQVAGTWAPSLHTHSESFAINDEAAADTLHKIFLFKNGSAYIDVTSVLPVESYCEKYTFRKAYGKQRLFLGFKKSNRCLIVI